MRITIIFKLMILFVVIYVSIPKLTYADQTQDFVNAQQAFKEKKYQQALELFLQAQKNGLDNVSLTYNIAVNYFKLEQYPQASVQFSKLLEVPGMQNLVKYNLGLIAIKTNDIKTAEQWFIQVSNSSSDEKLKQLALLQLDHSKLAAKNQSRRKIFFTHVRLGYLYDNNVTLVASERATGIKDEYLELYASLDATITGTLRNGLVVEAFYYLQDYQSNLASLNDFDEIGIGLFKTTNKYNWDHRFGVQILSSTFGVTDYQKIISAEYETKKIFKKNQRFYFRYRYRDISSDTVRYNYLDGWKQQFRFEYRGSSKMTRTRVRYEFEENNRTDRLTRSYSPQRHTIKVIANYYFTNKYQFKADIGYRYSDYPQLATQNRTDKRSRAIVNFIYYITKNWQTKVQYKYINNNSTDVNFDYKQNVYGAYIKWRY